MAFSPYNMVNEKIWVTRHIKSDSCSKEMLLEMEKQIEKKKKKKKKNNKKQKKKKKEKEN